MNRARRSLSPIESENNEAIPLYNYQTANKHRPSTTFMYFLHFDGTRSAKKVVCIVSRVAAM